MCDLLQKIELIHAAGTQFTPPYAHEVAKTFYEILTILDGKGLALLAFDGIVVAATTFAAEKANVFHKQGLARWLATAVIVLSLAAAALCLGVAEVSYRFLHYVECTGPARWTTPTRSITSRLWSIGGRAIIKLPGGVRLSRFRCFLSCFGCRCTCEIGATPRVNERDRRLG